MEQYSQAALQKLDKIFFDAARRQLRFLDKTKVRVVEFTAPSTTTMYAYEDGAKTMVVEEYADYYELKREDDLEEMADKLGFVAGSLFNSLASHAMRKHGWGVTIVDPLSKNLKFTVLCNPAPSVSDPAGISLGWMAFRFQFGAGA